MVPGFRRVRGALLRLAYDRRAAVAAGLVLLAPAVWARAFDRPWETAWAAGIVFVAAATGAALIFAGLSGRRPDWIEPHQD